jgi:hypothetical protein
MGGRGNNYPNALYFYVPTPAGVPFPNTGDSNRQTVWFQAHFYRVVRSSWTKLADTRWFYSFVTPGTVTARYWYRYADNALGAYRPWQWATRGDGRSYVARYDLYWYQNGRLIHQDALWPTHTYDLRDGTEGRACCWPI